MGTVTLDTMKGYGIFFSTSTNGDDKAKMNIVIEQAEKHYLNKVLSPQLAIVFNANPSDTKFAEIRAGFINDDNDFVNGLDYALNNYCAIAVLENCNYSIVNKKFEKTTSENTVEFSGSFIKSTIYNECSEIGEQISLYVSEDSETFPEFTEAKGIGTRNYFDL